MGSSGSVSIDFSTSENRTAAEAGGKGVTTGIGIGNYAISADSTISMEGGKPITTASIGFGVAPNSILVSNDVHTYYTETKVYTVKIGIGGFIDKVKDFGKRVADKIMGTAGKYDRNMLYYYFYFRSDSMFHYNITGTQSWT